MGFFILLTSINMFDSFLLSSEYTNYFLIMFNNDHIKVCYSLKLYNIKTFKSEAKRSVPPQKIRLLILNR